MVRRDDLESVEKKLLLYNRFIALKVFHRFMGSVPENDPTSFIIITVIMREVFKFAHPDVFYPQLYFCVRDDAVNVTTHRL